ncbi:MAG: hypothetical protein ACLUIX_10630 [Oscillospiraceae bacterium]
MGKNMTSGARRLSGNAVTLLITALLCGGSAALIYSGAASRQISNMLISMLRLHCHGRLPEPGGGPAG